MIFQSTLIMIHWGDILSLPQFEIDTLGGSRKRLIEVQCHKNVRNFFLFFLTVIAFWNNNTLLGKCLTRVKMT
jgi:hypothetical protein